MKSKPAPRSLILGAVLLAFVFLPMIQISQAAGPPYSWTGPALIASYTGPRVGDVLPSAYQASNGTLWLAFQSDFQNPNGSIYYKTMTGGSWSPDRILTTTSTGFNSSPSITQLSNGTIIIFWAYKASSGGSFNMYYKRYVTSTNSWAASVHLTTTTLDDTSPSTAVGADGRLWLFWQRINKTGPPTFSEDRQLYSKTLYNGAWSSDSKLTSDSNWNWGPSAIVGKDGKVRVVWSKGNGVASIYNLYTMVYDGAAWGAQTCISTASACSSPVNSDEQPSLIQDRNGTLWLFWGRQQSSSTEYWYVLFDKYSVNNGQTWSSETQLTSDASPITSMAPALVQTNSGSDKAIRVFYASDRISTSGYLQIWDYVSPQISPVHDVRVTSVIPSNTLQYPGGLASVGMGPIVNVLVSVSNLGDALESNVQVSVSFTNTTIYNLPVQTSSISVGGFHSYSFSWNTTNVPPARYTMTATATPVTGETTGNAGDNSWSQKNGVHIIPFGDVDQNGQVSLTDVSVFVYGFGATPGSPRWNPFCDLNNSGIIDLIDVGVAVHNFGIVT